MVTINAQNNSITVNDAIDKELFSPGETLEDGELYYLVSRWAIYNETTHSFTLLKSE